MGWSWARALACWCALVLVSAASEDKPDMLQREASFDLEELLQGASQLEPDMTQREVDFGGLWEPIEFPVVEQREVTYVHEDFEPDLLKVLKERAGSRAADIDMTQREITLHLDTDFTPGVRPMAGPRSFGDSHPSVLFPPGQPSPNNLQAICLHSSRRPRYPAYSLPQTGFGYLRRQGDAINRIESWYSACCHRNGTQQVQEVTLCCVTQAWEQTLSTFCTDEFSVKTRHHHCCKKEGGDRLSCFHSQTPNPNYLPNTQGAGSSPIPEPGFTFNPNTCHKSQPGPRIIRGEKLEKSPQAPPRDSNISFPPGRPTFDNIGLVCRLRKHRPLYTPKCLPRTGFGWLARQSKAVNRLERGFKHCCKGQGDVLPCAEGKWREVLDRFCEEEQKGRLHNSSCCDVGEGEERYTCFSSRAPHPDYDQKLDSAAPQTHNLGHICETYKIIKKKFPVALPVQNLVVHCCPLPADQRTACVQEKLVTLAESRCSAEKPSSSAVFQKCCPPSSQDAPKCLSGLLMNAITKATKSPHLRKRKCPLA
ncbi:extracellular matrix protein 1 isoform X1 [Salmo salar]|uniref:Extracellular matrix protein 1 isoform X1 n=1 Tax=Salmo salar TaxID=8030 RepID=A0ABM3EV33_SALSA|nr:extracellular matrix protein 1 isoform X1 [Salmo salar]